MVSVEILRSSPYFGGVSVESLKAIAQIAEERPFAAGQTLFKEGDASSTLFFVQRGELDVIYTLHGGDEVVVDTVVGGDLIGWSALVEPHQTTATVVSRSNGQALCIDGPKLRQLCEQDHTLGHRLMTHIAETLSKRLQGARVQLAAAG